VGNPQYFTKPTKCTDVVFIFERQIVIVHGFIKQTQKTPQDELELARKRIREITA